MADRPRPVEHPTPLTYVKAAAVLSALTALEVAVFYIDFLEPAFLAIFLILSVVKFALVVMFYMHLKYDSRFFSTVFVGGLVLAIAVVVAVMALFQVLSAKSNPPEVEAAAAHTETVDGGEGPSTPPTPPEGPVDTEPEPSTDLVARGQEIFTSAPASVGVQALWCSACHTIEGVAIGLIGPDLTHIGTEGAGRKPGTSAEAYIRESIMEPEDFVAEGVDRATKGLMTNAVTKGLNKDQVDALVAFLLEQK